jgi:hypothetical protein
MTNSSIINAFKSWIFPGLVTALATSIWYDVTQIKTDIRILMVQSNIDKTRIDNLERRVNNIELSIYIKPIVKTNTITGVLPSKYFLKEEEMDINKYLKKRV